MARIVRQTDANECRRCSAYCDRVIAPAACVARQCPFLYAYDEPPTWHLPVRHNLGAVLLKAGRPADAERVYRADLEVFRENGWALAGLRSALLAQGKEEEAAAVEARLAEAWREADVDVPGSRFAR